MSDLKTEVADIITGGGCQVERWDEALDRADEIIDIVRAKAAGAKLLRGGFALNELLALATWRQK